MLGFLRRSQRWLLSAVILLVGGVFVFYLGIGGAPGGALPPSTVLDVGGRRYSVRDVLRVRQTQEDSYRAALGDDFDAQGASELLDQLAVSSLERRAYMAFAAEEAGFRASDGEVRAFVRRIPGALDEQGRLDAEAVRFSVEREYGTERRFVESVRDGLLQDKLRQLLAAAVRVSKAEARESLRLRREEIRIAYVSLDRNLTPGEEEVPEQELAGVLADEARLRRFYEEHADRYRLPERVQARHILLRVAPDAPEERVKEVRRKAQQIHDRIAAGEDLAELARELSEDPGTRERGGDLGVFTRGQMTQAFEEVAFALQPGELSEPVRTDSGFHVLRVEAHRPPEERPFDAVKQEIARELARADRSRGRSRAQADRLAEAIRQGQSLEEAARAEGLTLERPDWIRRSDEGRVPGLGPAPEVLAVAFAVPDEHPSSDRVFDLDDRLVLVQRLERRLPSDEELKPEIEKERERLLRARQLQAQQIWLETTRRELVAEGRVRRDLSPLQGS